MLVVALVMIPIVFELQDNFVNYKSTQVNLTTKQENLDKFLDWMIFIEKQDSDKYENIIMYRPKHKADDKEQLIIAKEAHVQRKDDSFAFSLNQGKMYNFEQGQSIFSGELTL